MEDTSPFLANLLGGQVIVQRLADLARGQKIDRREDPERPHLADLAGGHPGDLSFVLPYRHLTDIIEMLEALDGLVPGINSNQTLLYGVEVKFYSLQLKLSRCMETEIPNLFGAGDGVGVSRGLVQASASGLIAAREVAKRIGGDLAKNRRDSLSGKTDCVRLPIPSLNGGSEGGSDYEIARERDGNGTTGEAEELKILECWRPCGKVPRHLFVDEALAARAYGDYPLPIGEKQTISQPYMVALMTEALAPGPKDRILEIGTGSGYQTAILAELCSKVFSIERIKVLAERAEKTLKNLGYSNFLIRVGDGSEGWKEEAPFEGILVTAGAPSVPKVLRNNSRMGGDSLFPWATNSPNP